MAAAWIASDVRATAIAHRTLGVAATRAVAAQGSLPNALTLLGNSPYQREIRPGQSLEEAQHAVAATMLWNTRVLAGWAPAEGIAMMRVLAGWHEIANIEARIRARFGASVEPLFRLGGLSVGWTKIVSSTSTAELCDRLATTPWGRPDDESARTIGLTLRASLLQRASATLPGCGEWISAAAALLLVRERLHTGASLPARAAHVFSTLLGSEALEAPPLPPLLESLPAAARWPFVDVAAEDDLWRAESHWWARVESDGRTRMRGSSFGPAPVVGAVAVMGADAWRVRAALTAAANGERGLEEFDALA